jgi:hypothetical protein
MSQDVPLYNVPAIEIAASDGTVFTCRAYRLAGASRPSDLPWQLTDPNGHDHMGPPYVRDESADELQRRVTAWWDAYKALRELMVRPNDRDS